MSRLTGVVQVYTSVIYPAIELLSNEGCAVCGLRSLAAANTFKIYMHAAAASERNGGVRARSFVFVHPNEKR